MRNAAQWRTSEAISKNFKVIRICVGRNYVQKHKTKLYSYLHVASGRLVTETEFQLLSKLT